MSVKPSLVRVAAGAWDPVSLVSEERRVLRELFIRFAMAAMASWKELEESVLLARTAFDEPPDSVI